MSPSLLADPATLPAADVAPAPGVEPVSEDGRWVSEEAYWREYYFVSDIHYEWNNGRLEEKPVSDYETYLVYRWFMLLLEHFLTSHPIARTVALEMGFRLPLPQGVVIRKPDLGVVRNDNPQPLLPHDCSYHGVFDLCIEALSDRERRGSERDTVVKKAEYAAGGVSEYVILHREPAQQAFYTLGPDGVYVPIAPTDGLICSRVLPGFRFRRQDLCRRPLHASLRDDPVYAHFVLPHWRQAEQRADAEAQRADVEARRADDEARRANDQARRADEAVRRAAAEAAARADAERRAAAAEAALAQLRAERTGRSDTKD